MCVTCWLPISIEDASSNTLGFLEIMKQEYSWRDFKSYRLCSGLNLKKKVWAMVGTEDPILAANIDGRGGEPDDCCGALIL